MSHFDHSNVATRPGIPNAPISSPRDDEENPTSSPEYGRRNSKYQGYESSIGNSAFHEYATQQELSTDAISVEVLNNNPLKSISLTKEQLSGIPCLPPGSVSIGPFLGKGAFGQVYQGQWGKYSVALKELDVSQAQKKLNISSIEVVEALQWEISRLSTVSHPNLVQFYGVYQHQEVDYVVMEFCDSGTLQDMLEKDLNKESLTELDWTLRWQWALEVTQGLAYLHRQGIVHRDLKAENVLLDSHPGGNRAKLADLGVSQVDALLQQTEASVVAKGLQDSRFIAPETLHKKTTLASDIYALGIVFWQLATGKEPRQAKDTKELLSWFSSGEREPIPSHCSPELRKLILECWHLNPVRRPTAEILVERLGDLTPTWMKRYQRVEAMIQSKRMDCMSYISPFLTQNQLTESSDAFWQRTESTTGEHKDPEVLVLNLDTTLENFLQNPEMKSLVLLGEAGVGKSLSTYRLTDMLATLFRQHLQFPQGLPPYYPVLVRPILNNWSHSELEQGLQKALHAYGWSNAPSNARLLVIIDGYDELQANQTPTNLAAILGLEAFPRAKLLVTCRPETVEKTELAQRFGIAGKCEVYYFLPFNQNQLLGYLQERLSWSKSTYQSYEKQLQDSKTLRVALRNPFVLSLFAQSFETLSKKDFKSLSRWKIYQGFVEHWINTKQSLLSSKVQSILSGNLSLLPSFNAFCEEIAFGAYNQEKITFSTVDVETHLSSSAKHWLHLKDLVVKDSQETFIQRQNTLVGSNRALLSEENFTQVMLGRLSQFEQGSPLKSRGAEQEFAHKSFFEYFVAKRIVELRDLDQKSAVEEGLRLLNHRLIQAEPGILTFILEAWFEPDSSRLTATLWQMIERSKKDPKIGRASANAATILNASGISFSLVDWNGIRIPGANLAGAVLDGTQLERADLQGVNLRGAWLNNANFTDALMAEVNFGEYPSILVGSEFENCCFSKDGRYSAVAVYEIIKLYDISTRTLLFTFLGHTKCVSSLAFNLDGTRLASGDMNNTLRVWEVDTRECIGVFLGHISVVHGVAFSPDGRQVVSGSWDTTVRLWDIESKECLRVFLGHEEIIESVAFRPDGKQIASGSEDSTIRIWDPSTGECLKILTGHIYKVTSIVFTLDGTQLISGGADKTLRLWDLQSGKSLRAFLGHTSDVTGVALSPDGKQLASASGDNMLRLWDIGNDQSLKIFAGHTNLINDIAFSSNGKELMSGSRDGTLRRWDTRSEEGLRPFSGHVRGTRGVAFSPDGKYLVSGGWDGPLRLWELGSGQCSKTFYGHPSCVVSVAFSPDGKQIASGGWDKKVWLWDVGTGQSPKRFLGHTEYINSVVFSPNGKQLASGGDDNAIRLWKIEDGECLKVFLEHIQGVTSVKFSPDGRQLASASTDETLRLWDLSTGLCLRAFSKHTSWVLDVAFSPNGKQLVSGSLDKTLRLWDVESGKCIETFSGHKGGVNNVSFSPHGGILVSGDGDTTLRLWNVSNGKNSSTNLTSETWSVEWFGGPQAFSFALAGLNFLATGHHDGSIGYWRFKDGHLTLLWSSYQTSLVSHRANLQGVHGLSTNNASLLQQKGAIGTPEPSTQVLVSIPELPTPASEPELPTFELGTLTSAPTQIQDNDYKDSSIPAPLLQQNSNVDGSETFPQTHPQKCSQCCIIN